VRTRRLYSKSIFYDNSLINQPLKLSERIVRMAQRDPKRAKRAKIAVARTFGLPTWKYVNLENALEFMKWKRSPEAQVEDFLDKLDAERQKLEG
jgi:hypothetical protein